MTKMRPNNEEPWLLAVPAILMGLPVSLYGLLADAHAYEGLMHLYKLLLVFGIGHMYRITFFSGINMYVDGNVVKRFYSKRDAVVVLAIVVAVLIWVIGFLRNEPGLLYQEWALGLTFCWLLGMAMANTEGLTVMAAINRLLSLLGMLILILSAYHV